MWPTNWAYATRGPRMLAREQTKAVAGVRAGHAILMGQPRLATWGLCIDGVRVLVQFSADEALFRLPGGTIE